ncbi:hypothetical protein CMI47_11450 [Candidatus Pacearchaeota archaeon]|nr:hypothetical protein [Candidatus Pacearchaeota archaeon]|tara:strand:- start:314 stop:547 length:234 start_codon:yes stop_codon:yes gene_type:complete
MSSPAIHLLRESVRQIIIELGQLKQRGFKGYGASMPYVDAPEKMMLGKVEIFDDCADNEKGPVKISRAFLSEPDADL